MSQIQNAKDHFTYLRVHLEPKPYVSSAVFKLTNGKCCLYYGDPIVWWRKRLIGRLYQIKYENQASILATQVKVALTGQDRETLDAIKSFSEIGYSEYDFFIYQAVRILESVPGSPDINKRLRLIDTAMSCLLYVYIGNCCNPVGGKAREFKEFCENALRDALSLVSAGYRSSQGQDDIFGKLAGPEGNRVKAVKLRGCLSQGLLYPVQIEIDEPLWDEEACTFVSTIAVLNEARDEQDFLVFDDGLENVPVEYGQDVSRLLDIEKWEPPIPDELKGEVTNLYGKTVPYDIENLKMFPDALNGSQKVQITEKLHGVFMEIGYWPGLNHPDLLENGDVFVTSKGLAAKGLVFMDCPENADNLYLKAYHSLTNDAGSLIDRIRSASAQALPGYIEDVTPVFVCAELFGRGVQDLEYGQSDLCIRGFDVFIGSPQFGHFLDVEEKRRFFHAVDIPQVPVLYEGPWDRSIADELHNGQTDISEGAHFREGVVITPFEQFTDDRMGRVILKYHSDAYLTRKRGTEYT